MTFFNTWAFGFLGITPVIVLLYLLKLKRAPLPVSTLMFWQRVLQENRRGALFQKLRQWLSLLFHLLIFALILLALARPTLDRSIRDGASTVIVLDDRARMQAIEPGGPSRFEKAIRLAETIVNQAGPLRQIAVLGTAGEPSVKAPFTGDEKRLRESLQVMRPTDAGGDLLAAIDLARQLLASRSGDRRIVVVTDRPLDLPHVQDAPNPEVMAVGTTLDNVAITRFTTRPLPADPDTSEILLRIRNFGQTETMGNVEIALDGRLLDVKPFRLAPRAERMDVFPFVPPPRSKDQRGPDRGWLTARFDARDALSADNTAYALLPPRSTARVLLVTNGNWFMEKLLESEPGLHFELLTPDAYQPELGRQFDVTIFDNYLPAGFDLMSIKGNILFLGRTPFSTPSPPVEHPIITESDATHPVFRLVNMEHVSLLRAIAAELPPQPPGGWTLQAPLRSFDHPLLISGERRTESGELRLAAVTFDIAESDLPLRVAFPLLMSNAIHWLAGDHPAVPLSVQAGHTIPLAENERIELRPVPAPHTEGGAIHDFAPLTNGFYQIHHSGHSSSWASVNTFDETESDLRISAAQRLQLPSLSGSLSSHAYLGAFFEWPIWQYLTLAAIGLFTLEWWLYHRRRTE